MEINNEVLVYRKKKWRSVFFMLILTFFSTNSIASSMQENVLQLDDALSLAYGNNPRVIEAKQNVKIAEVRYRQVKKFENPELEFEISKIPNDIGDKNVFDSDVIEGSLGFSQPIQTFGKRGLTISIAEDEKVQVELVLKRILFEVGRQVKEQYSKTVLYQKSADLARDNLQRAQRLLDQVNIKYNVGKARNHEIARARLALANARNELLAVENSYKVAIRELNILIGQDIASDITLVDNLSLKEMEYNLDMFLTKALKNRSDILSQEQEILKKDKELDLSKRKRFPDVNLGLFVEREEAVYGLGAGISFEFPIWNQFQEEITEASLEKEIAEINLQTLKREVELDVYKAFQNADLARKFIINLEDAIKEANELLRIITIEYQEGEATFLIYLEGLTSYKETKQKYLESLADYSGKLAVLEQAVEDTLLLKEKH